MLSQCEQKGGMTLEFQLLESFVAVAKTLNFTKAAQEIHITQSTMSSRINKLESELGVPLFLRLGREIKLSQYGEILLPYAEKCLEIRDSALRRIEEEKGILTSSLLVSAASPFGLFILPKILPSLYAAFPNLNIQVLRETGYSEEILRMVVEAQIDIGVINYVKRLENEEMLNQNSFTVIPLYETDLVLLARPGHPVLQRAPLQLRDLQEVRFAMLGKRTSITQFVTSFFQKSNLEFRLDYYINSIAGIKEVIRQTDMMTLLPRMQIESDLNHGSLIEIKLAESLPPIGTYLVYTWKNIKSVESIVELLKNRTHDLIKQLSLPCRVYNHQVYHD
jgi:LysR family cyn operon transcriptional activator